MFVSESTNEIFRNVKSVNVKNATETENLVLMDKRSVLIYTIS